MSTNAALSIGAIHDGLEKKRFSVKELTTEYLKAIQEKHDNAYLTVCRERALTQAERLDQLLAGTDRVPLESFPLFGVPMGVKDVLTVQGVRTTCASRILENYTPPYTSTAVERLEAAGAITLGKLNMDEFAMGSSNENSAFGSVVHPTHPGRVPGGSSGGSAASVRAGTSVFSLGTDTGGSIRLPAAYCGVVGVKPTYGRVSRYGLIAFASSLDQIGPLTNSVEDATRVLDVMVGPDARDSTCAPVLKGNWLASLERSVPWKKIRVGVPKEYFIGGLSPEVEKAVQSSLKWFEGQGAKLVEVSLPHTRYAVATYYVVAVSEASSNLARFDGIRFGMRPEAAAQCQDIVSYYKKVRGLFGPEVKRRIILGTFALSSGYYDAYYRRACQVRRRIKQDFDQAFEKVDIIASPVSPVTAFKVGERSKDPLQMYLVDTFTIPASLAGLPALSLPCGEDSEGLSIGLQMIGPQFGEEKLLPIAHAFERFRQ